MPKSSKGITQMAFSLTGDIGEEKGDGVNGFNGFKKGLILPMAMPNILPVLCFITVFGLPMVNWHG